MNIYELTHTASCPNGELEDTYDITITTNSTLQVENLLEVVSSSPKSIYQEDLADYIRSRVPARIEIVGHHYGVKITCIRH